MQKVITDLSELKLLGISTRTSNSNETNPETAKILPTIQNWFHNQLAAKIPNRKKPTTTYCVYTQYESDENGEYTYFVGEEVSNHDNIPDSFECLTIPSQTYVKFTNGPSAMPEVCISVWQDIWNMNAVDLGGRRTYLADFEIYDERAQDPQNTVLDIYIGIQS